MIIRSWRAVAGSDEVLAAYADHLKRTTFVGKGDRQRTRRHEFLGGHGVGRPLHQR